MPTIARIQFADGATVVTGAATIGITLDASPINKNALVMVIGLDSNSASVTSISQTGATWVRLTQFQDATSTRAIEWWIAYNVSGASTAITVNLSPSATAIAIVAEYSGLVLASALDKSNNNSSASPSTTVDSGVTATTTQKHELWLTGTFQHHSYSPGTGGAANTLGTPNNGYSLIDQLSVQSGGTIVSWRNVGFFEKIVDVTGTAGNNCTVTGVGNSQTYVATAIALFAQIRRGPPPLVINPPSQQRALQF